MSKGDLVLVMANGPFDGCVGTIQRTGCKSSDHYTGGRNSRKPATQFVGHQVRLASCNVLVLESELKVLTK